MDKVGDCMFKVIIADDEVIEIEYLHKMFQKHSEEFQITGIASNGKDVLRLAEETIPDAVIIDICMPVSISTHLIDTQWLFLQTQILQMLYLK